jgi:hypothetical protein
LMVSLEPTAIVLTVARSGRDWVCTICIRGEDIAGRGGQSLSSFRAVVALGLSGFLGGIDGGRGERGNRVAVFIGCKEEMKGSRSGVASFDGRRMVDRTSTTTRGTCSSWQGGNRCCSKAGGSTSASSGIGKIQISIIACTRFILYPPR